MTVTEVLFVCTANQCRSPMAAALLDKQLRQRSNDVRASSAGVAAGDAAVPDEVLRVTRDVGLDLSAHRSRRIDRSLIEHATLVLTMTRSQLMEVVVTAPEAWNYSFTFRELLQRARIVGPRPAGQTVEAWIAYIHSGRSRAGLLTRDPSEDIADPMGQRLRAFERTRDELDGLATELASLLCPSFERDTHR